VGLRKIVIFGCLVFFSSVIFATGPLVLNSVSYQITEQQWVKTNRATATVSMSATLASQDVQNLHESIRKDLHSVIPGEWHIIQFQRQKAESGLEVIEATAQIRASVDDLDQIYQRIGRIAQPGRTYRVVSLVFNPDLADIAAANDELRQKMYREVQKEIKILNDQFPSQKFVLHQMNFINAQQVSTPGPLVRSQTMALGRETTSTSAFLSVSQRIQLTATVTLSQQFLVK